MPQSASLLKRIMRFLSFTLLICVLLVFAPNLRAQSPTEQMQDTMDRIIAVLRTIRSPEDVEKNREALHRLLIVRFDFTAMAKRSLGNRWSDLDGKEGAFVAVFTDYVEHAYMSTLGSYRGEKVVYDRDQVEGELAEVDTRVIGGEGAPIKIQYKLNLTDGEWLVYDAVIDEVSVVENYRSQFARVLRTASLEDLIQSLRAKASQR